MEILTRAIANEYRDRALLLPSNGLQDIGERRTLREELQVRCNLTELQAVNIINGFHIPDYVRIAEVRAALLQFFEVLSVKLRLVSTVEANVIGSDGHRR